MSAAGNAAIVRRVLDEAFGEGEMGVIEEVMWVSIFAPTPELLITGRAGGGEADGLGLPVRSLARTPRWGIASCEGDPKVSRWTATVI